jgi:hypothetical protein
VVIEIDEIDVEIEITEMAPSVEASITKRVALALSSAGERREKRDASSKRLFTALNQEKIIGARSLVKSIIDLKVEITISNLLTRSGDARRLLFSARE